MVRVMWVKTWFDRNFVQKVNPGTDCTFSGTEVSDGGIASLDLIIHVLQSSTILGNH